MMRRALPLALALVAIAPIAGLAQDSVSPLIGAPIPADTVPNMEMVGGSAGSTNTYRRGDAAQPRISRTGKCTLLASGACTGPWDGAAFPAGATLRYVGDPTPINAGSQPISCNYTATPTTSGFAVKCWQGQSSVLSLSLVTSGTTVLPFATPAAGIEVQATAIPAS